MLRSVRTYVSDRRNGLTKAAGIVGGLYFVRRYVMERLEEVKEQLEEQRQSRENLKRRFSQTQDDVSYTILALIQTLSDQVLREMDVEALTKELQDRSRARQEARRQLEAEPERPPSSLASSVELDTRSESSYGVISSMSGSGLLVESSGSTSLIDLSESMTSTSSALSGTSENAPTSSVTSQGSQTTSELWNEVKILTVTRTLTTLYSTTLLSLLTSIQLTLLARSRYVQSVVQLARDEMIRERFEAEFSFTNILLGRGKVLEELMSGDPNALLGGVDIEPVEAIDEETESRFLTMSWWILHVGWKDVGERVRKGVEEAFDGVSLKSKLAAMDLHRLVSDVRRRVEHEVTFEGTERRINFLSSLLPQTPETTQHVLTQGGFPSIANVAQYDDASSSADLSRSPSHSRLALSSTSSTSSPPAPSFVPSALQGQPPAFTVLLSETRDILASPDFAHVLEVCLDRATEILFLGLEREVFGSADSQSLPSEPVRIRLAALLPGLARWSQVALDGLPNQLVDNLLSVREVECLSAIVFGKFEDRLR